MRSKVRKSLIGDEDRCACGHVEWHHRLTNDDGTACAHVSCPCTKFTTK